MNAPDPTDWESYIITQMANAAAGSISSRMNSVGVVVDGIELRIVVQMSGEVNANEVEDIYDIESELGGLVGDDVNIRVETIVSADHVCVQDSIRWVYLKEFPTCWCGNRGRIAMASDTD